MSAVTKYEGKIFGTVNAEVGMEIGAKQTVLSHAVTMISDKRVDGFITTLLGFVAKNPGLVLGPQDVNFRIEATIAAQVGGSSGYLGNVQYVQDPTVINVKLGGKPEEVQAFLHRDATTTTAAQTTTTTAGTEAATTTEVPTTTTEAPTTTQAPTTTTEAPLAETTTTSASTIVKRQDVSSTDVSPDLLKAALNKMFAEVGQPALFPAA